MFRSLMTIIRELYLYLTKVIFMLKHSVKLHRYIYLVMWQHDVKRHAATSPKIYRTVGSPSGPWTEKTIERLPIFVRRVGHCWCGDLVGRTTF